MTATARVIASEATQSRAAPLTFAPSSRQQNTVIPAKARIHLSSALHADQWIPAFAGMTIQ
jgi:hypothetical protein